MNMPLTFDGLYAKFVRRGLPADYARRATSEIVDHYADLMIELRAAGMNEPEATAEAERRLGDQHTVVKKTVREYQKRYWCARWPLITFLLAPIPVLIASWYAFGLAVYLVVYAVVKLGLVRYADPDAMFMALPVGVKSATLFAMFLVVPAMVVYGYARLAKRAAVNWQWVVLVACVLGVVCGAMKWERVVPGRMKMYDRLTMRELEAPQGDYVLTLAMPVIAESWTWQNFHRWFLSSPRQLCQLLLPIVLAAALLARWRHLMLRSERQFCSPC